jgi:hypothetical protein
MSGIEHNPEVVATELEEGAVLLNMATSFYYSLNEPGAEIWRGVGAAEEPAALAERLSARFEVEAARAVEAAASFVAELEREGLVVEGDGAPTSASRPSAPADGRQPFSDPELVKHDEPLHEVSMSPFDPQLPLAE